MAVVTVQDLENAKADVEHIAELATSPATTSTDRLGQQKKTWTGIKEELEAEAAITQTWQNAAAAEGARGGSEAARDSTFILGNTAVDIATGRASVADGARFKAVAGPEEVGEFQRTSSTTQDFITSVPSANLVRRMASDAAAGVIEDPALDIIPLVMDDAGGVQVGYRISTQELLGPAVERAVGKRGEEGRGKVLPPSLFTLTPVSSAIWFGVVWHGQSNPQGATGQYGSLPVSTTQPYFNRTFSGGTKADTPAGMAGDMLLVEQAYGGVDIGYSETPVSGTANYAITWGARNLGINPATCIFFGFTGGEGGLSITQISKPGGPYTNLMAQVDAFVARAVAAGKTPIIQDVLIDVGETDNITGTTQAAFETLLKQMRTDLDTDIRAKTGQTNPVHLLVVQTSYGARLRPAVARAQFNVCKTHDYIHFTHASYFLPFEVDGTHRTEWGHREQGNVAGRSQAQLVFEGRVPDWIEPISAVAIGTQLRIRFKVPRPPLRFDLNTIAQTDQYGFAVSDSGGAVTLSNIHIENGVEVVATMSRVTTLAAAPEARYGFDAIAAKLASGPITDGASGNLRDSTGDTYTIDGVVKDAAHWAPHFYLPITVLEA